MEHAKRLFEVTAAVLLLASAQTAAGEDNGATDVARGARLWANTCSRCHNMRDPQEFRDDQWRVIVTHMRVQAGLTGGDARLILTFLQNSNAPTSTRAGAPRSRRTSRTHSPPAEPTSSTARAGAAIYGQTCVACHGPAGHGSLPGVIDLAAPDGPLSKPDATLVRVIREGYRSGSSPLAMPPKGGNASLTDRDIENVITYMREAFGVPPGR